MKILSPPGSKEHPIVRKCRVVDPTTNPSIIIGIPKRITEMAGTQKGDEFLVYFEPTEKSYRIVMDKI